MYTDKFPKGESSKQETWELIHPVPLNSDGSLKDGGPLENMDVHYIYVCTKVGVLTCYPLVSHFVPCFGRLGNGSTQVWAEMGCFGTF